MQFLEVLKKVAIEFCTETSLHGVQYTVEPRRAPIERLFWRLAIFVAFIASVLCFRTVYIGKYSQSQVRTSLAANIYPSSALEQPAITICNSNKVFQSSVDRFFKMMSFDDEEKEDQLKQSLPRFIQYFYTQNSKKTLSEMHVLMKWTDYIQNMDWTMSDYLLLISPQCSEMLVKCHANGINIDCSDIFKVTRTGIGFCCSFDYIQKKDALLMRQYQPEKPPKFLGLSRQYGFEDGLAVLLNLSSEGSIYTAFYRDSAAVFIHSPKEFPSIQSVKVYISGGTETFFRFSSIGMMGTPGLEDVDPSIRQCYMKDEIKLKYFDHYTLGNCAMESFMELLISKCNCLLTILPNPGIYKDCTIFNDLCVDLLISKRKSDSVQFITIDDKRIPCLERCTYVRYSPTVTFGDFDVPEYNAFQLWDGVNVTGLTLLHLFQQSPNARVFKRSASMNHWEILVVVGGLVGVVFGLNLLNIVEFVYFFTFRFYYYMKKQFNSLSTNKKSEINLNMEQKPMRIFVTSHHDDI